MIMTIHLSALHNLALLINVTAISIKTLTADDDQWRYSPDRALASLYGFHDSFL
jgi:hypothetical protein